MLYIVIDLLYSREQQPGRQSHACSACSRCDEARAAPDSASQTEICLTKQRQGLVAAAAAELQVHRQEAVAGPSCDH